MNQPSSPDQWRVSGLAASGRADWATAADHLNRYLSLAPHDTVTHYSLAEVYFQVGRPDYAVQLMDGLVRTQPQNPDAHFYRGCVFQRLGRPAEAAADYQRALQLRPLHPGAMQALAALGAAPGPVSPPGAYGPGAYPPVPTLVKPSAAPTDSDDLMSLMGWGVISVVGIVALIATVSGILMVSTSGGSAQGWLLLSVGLLLLAGVIAGVIWMTRREIKTL